MCAESMKPTSMAIIWFDPIGIDLVCRLCPNENPTNSRVVKPPGVAERNRVKKRRHLANNQPAAQVMVRIKRRYLLTEITLAPGSSVTAADIGVKQLASCVRQSVQRCFGNCGVGQMLTTLKVKYLNPATGLALVSCRRHHLPMLQASLTCLSSIATAGALPLTVAFRTVHVSGSIRQCARFWIRHHEQLMFEQLRACTDPRHKAHLIQLVRRHMHAKPARCKRLTDCANDAQLLAAVQEFAA